MYPLGSFVFYDYISNSSGNLAISASQAMVKNMGTDTDHSDQTSEWLNYKTKYSQTMCVF